MLVAPIIWKHRQTESTWELPCDTVLAWYCEELTLTSSKCPHICAAYVVDSFSCALSDREKGTANATHRKFSSQKKQWLLAQMPHHIVGFVMWSYTVLFLSFHPTDTTKKIYTIYLFMCHLGELHTNHLLDDHYKFHL